MTELADEQALEGQQPVQDAIVDSRDNTPAEQPKTIREALDAAVKEHSEPKPRDDKGKFAPKSESAPEKVEAAQVSKTEPEQPAQPSTAAGPPPGWSKESKEFFATLPADHPLRRDIAKREEEVSNGFKKYGDIAKRHEEIEQVLAPRRAEFQKFGITSDAQAINTLFAWEQAVRSNPQQAIAQLAKSYGVDLSTFAQAPQGQGENELPAQLRPVVDQFGNVVQKVDAVASRLDQYEAQRTQAEIQAFAKDKPHFERVRTLMGQIMAGGGATSLEDAYQKAIYADPETRSLIQKEEQDKAEAERKKAAEDKARAALAASSSVRGSSPQGSVQNRAKAKTNVSVRESLNDALKEARA
jgi:hypothetical protein